jgi:probable addiction module antidote protein
MRQYRSYKEHLIETLKDPLEASAYLEACLEEALETKEFGIFLLAVRDVIEAQGGIADISERMEAGRESLYKSLTKESKPRFSTIMLALRACGFGMGIHPTNNQTNQ